MPDPFIEQLKRLCRDHPYTAKWVVLPSPSIGWTIGERLLHEGEAVSHCSPPSDSTGWA